MEKETGSGTGRKQRERRSFSAYFTVAQLAALDRLSYERDVSRSVLIRLAVDRFLAKEEERRAGGK